MKKLYILLNTYHNTEAGVFTSKEKMLDELEGLHFDISEYCICEYEANRLRMDGGYLGSESLSDYLEIA